MTDARTTLSPLVGEWSLSMILPAEERPDPLPDIGARNTWSWLGDSSLLVQKWSIPVDEAPNGTAVIAWDDDRGTFLQHYFDDRDVVRVYELSLRDGELRLMRTSPDYSPFEFSQRYVGTVTEDRIDGAWWIAHDHETWEKDFDLVYTRVDVT